LFFKFHFNSAEHLQHYLLVPCGVRGGGAGEAAAAPRLHKFRANSVFQGKRKLLKILDNKKYIFNTVYSGHSLFLGKAHVAQKS